MPRRYLPRQDTRFQSLEEWQKWFEEKLSPAKPGDMVLILITHIARVPTFFSSHGNGPMDDYLRTEMYLATLEDIPFVTVQGMHLGLASDGYVHARIRYPHFSLIDSKLMLSFNDIRELDPTKTLPEQQNDDFWSGFVDIEEIEEKSATPAYPVYVITGTDEIQKFCRSLGLQMMSYYLGALRESAKSVDLPSDFAELELAKWEKQMRGLIKIFQDISPVGNSRVETILALLNYLAEIRKYGPQYPSDSISMNAYTTINIPALVAEVEKFVAKHTTK